MMELEALQAVWPQLRALGASLIAISPQPGQYGRAVRRRAKLEFDVLTDFHLRVAKTDEFARPRSIPTTPSGQSLRTPSQSFASSKQRGRRRRVDDGTSTRYRWRGVRYPGTATIPKGRVDRYMEHGW